MGSPLTRPLKQWTWADVERQEGGQLLQVMESHQPRFYYYNLRAEGGGSLRLSYRIHATMAASQLVHRVVHESTPPWYYYSAALNSSAPFSLEPFDVLSQSGRVPRAHQDPNIRANLWVSSANATSPLHYDASHNVFVQVVGRKRFLLVPPSRAHDGLALYSVHHPCHRASARGNVAELLESAELVDLEAGEVLYLPPFYLHQVTSLSPSCSVNMYIPAREVVKVQRIFSFRPPIDKTWLDLVRFAGVRVFLRALISRVEPDGLASFVATMLRERYDEALLARSDVISYPPARQPANVDDWMDTYCRPFVGNPAELERAAELLSQVFSELPAGVRAMVLMDYVDDALLAIVPDPRWIHAYLDLCILQQNA